MNKEFKETYIEKRLASSSVSMNTFNKIFKIVEQFENQYGKDASCFTEEEVLNVLKSINTSSFDYLNNIKSQLSIYTDYCIKHNLVFDGQNHYKNIVKEQLDKCVNKMINNDKIITKEELIKYSNAMEFASSKYIFWSLFEGIRGKDFIEITKLKIKDIDIQNKIVHTCNGREVDVGIEFISAAEECNEEMEYKREGGRKIELVPSDTIYKSVDRKNTDGSEEMENRRLGRRIHKEIKVVGREIIGSDFINAVDIFNSGRIDFILRRCREKGVEPYDYVWGEEGRAEIEAKYDGCITRSVFWNKYKNYLTLD